MAGDLRRRPNSPERPGVPEGVTTLPSTRARVEVTLGNSTQRISLALLYSQRVITSENGKCPKVVKVPVPVIGTQVVDSRVPVILEDSVP